MLTGSDNDVARRPHRKVDDVARGEGAEGMETAGECESYRRAVRAYLGYRKRELSELSEIRKAFRLSVPFVHEPFLPHSPGECREMKTSGLWGDVVERISRMEDCVQANAGLLERVVSGSGGWSRGYVRLDEGHEEEGESERGSGGTENRSDAEKVRTLLRMVARDWSEDGIGEREECYGAILDELEEAYGGNGPRNQFKVLVPGAGVGRLAWEIVMKGFCVQGNEFSFFSLLAANFMLNVVRERAEVIYPWVHEEGSNNKCADDLLRALRVPDVDPRLVEGKGDFSMCAGEFLAAYEDQEKCWDVIVTSFFIDTAHNIVAYLRRIAQLLKTGGRWINFGPLLYHYADMYDEPSIELSLKEVVSATQKLPLRVIKQESRHCRYASNVKSLLRMTYECAFIVAVKEEA